MPYDEIDRSPGSVGGMTPSPDIGRDPGDVGGMTPPGGPTTIIEKHLPRNPPAKASKWGSTPAHDGEDGAWREYTKGKAY